MLFVFPVFLVEGSRLRLRLYEVKAPAVVHFTPTMSSSAKLATLTTVLYNNHRRTGHGSFGGGQDQICPNFRQSPLRPRSSAV